jgi:hypothetical protein
MNKVFERTAFVAAFVFFCGLGTLMWQCYTWIKTGIWPWLPISRIFAPPATTRQELNQILEVIYDYPISIGLVVLSLFISIVGAMIHRFAEDWELKQVEPKSGRSEAA